MSLGLSSSLAADKSCVERFKILFKKNNVENVITTNVLGLNKKYRTKLNTIINSSAKSEEVVSFIETLDRPLLANVRNQLKFRSKSILKALEVVIESDLDSTFFLKKLLNGESLSLNEKRAYYLLTHKRLWFIDNLYKSMTSEVFSKISFLKLSELLSLDLLDSTFVSSFSTFYRDIDQSGILKKLLEKSTVEDRLNEELNLVLKSQKASLIAIVEQKMLKLEESFPYLRGMLLKRAQFQYDEIFLLHSKLIDSNPENKNLAIRHKGLFYTLPKTIEGVEGFSRMILAFSLFSYGSEILIKNFMNNNENGEDLSNTMTEVNLSKKEEVDLNISMEEILEEKFNSGEISLDQYELAMKNL